MAFDNGRRGGNAFFCLGSGGFLWIDLSQGSKPSPRKGRDGADLRKGKERGGSDADASCPTLRRSPGAKPPAPKGSPGEGRRLRWTARPGNQPGLHRPPCRRPSPGDHGHCGDWVWALVASERPEGDDPVGRVVADVGAAEIGNSGLRAPETGHRLLVVSEVRIVRQHVADPPQPNARGAADIGAGGDVKERAVDRVHVL